MDKISHCYNVAYLSTEEKKSITDNNMIFYTLYDQAIAMIEKYFSSTVEKINDYKKQFIIEHILEGLHFKDEKQ